MQGSVDTAPYGDAYLAPFAGTAGAAELVAACALARRLGWACRAVNGHLGGSEHEHTGVRLRMFLDSGV